MDYMVVFVVLLLGLVGYSEQQTYVGAECRAAVSGGAFAFTIRVNRDGNTALTGLQAYVAGPTPPTIQATGSGCSTSTLTSGGLYVLSFEVDTAGTTCGVSKVINDYTLAFRGEGTNQYYKVTCNPNTLQTVPTEVSELNYGTAHYKAHLELRSPPMSARFAVYQADGRTFPTESAYLGQDLNLKVVFNRGFQETGTVNFGYSFHTGFFPVSSDPVEYHLEISTPGLGTLIDVVIGPGAAGIWKYSTYVKRDKAAWITIPTSFVTGSYSTATWPKLNQGIKITSRHDVIGVKAVTTRPSSPPVFQQIHEVIPDELLGTSYHINTGLADTSNGQLVIVCKEATSMTFDFGSSIIKPATIATESVGASDPFTLTADVGANDVVRVFCGSKCEHLVVSGNKPFAVVAGHIASSLAITQLTPDDRLGNHFVTFATLLGDERYVFKASASNTMTTGSPNFIPNEDLYEQSTTSSAISAKEVVFDKPVQALLRYTTDAVVDTVRIPSVKEWGIHQSFYARKGYNYDIFIVTKKGEMSNIVIATKPSSIAYSTIGAAPGFASQLLDVVPDSGSTVNYEFYYHTNFVASDGVYEGLVELRAGSPNHPFMLLVRANDSSGDGYYSFFLPYGLRSPPVCTTPTTIPLMRLGHNYGNTVHNQPGDNLDNDCDGEVDEELLNGMDDDGDGLIDEDLSITEYLLKPAIRLVELEVAESEMFTGLYYKKIIENGCLTSVGQQSFSDLGPFTHVTNLGSIFNNYWVISSPDFGAFRWMANANTKVFFRATIGFCDGDPTLSTSQCTKSCQTPSGRKKRDADESVFQLVTGLRVNGGNVTVVETLEESEPPHPCRTEPVFLVPAALILAMLLVESTTIGYVFSRKMQMRN